MASILEQMIEANRRERNKNTIPVYSQNSNVKSVLHMAQTYANTNPEARPHNSTLTYQRDIDNQMAKCVRNMKAEEAMIVAIFSATSQNEKARKTLVKKIQKKLGIISESNFKYMANIIQTNVDKDLVAKVYEFLCNNIAGFKEYYMKYCYYQGF